MQNISSLPELGMLSVLTTNSDFVFILNIQGPVCQSTTTNLLELVHKHSFTDSEHPYLSSIYHCSPLMSNTKTKSPQRSRSVCPRRRLTLPIFLAAFATQVEEGEMCASDHQCCLRGSKLPLGNVLANKTLRLLTLVADRSKEGVKSPAFSVTSLVEPRASSTGAASSPS